MTLTIKQQIRLESYNALYDAVNLLVKHDIFRAGGELCALHFSRLAKEKGEPEGGYQRRPLMGLRLPFQGHKILARPAYKPGRRLPREERVKGRERYPGCLAPNKIEIQLVVKDCPPVLSITEDGAKMHRCSLKSDSSKNEERVKVIGRALREFIKDPFRVFAQHSLSVDKSLAGHCCCCGKALRDPISRLRGIGPECYQYFAHLENDAEVIREKFRSLEDDWLPGKAVVVGKDWLTEEVQ
jgi:Family of unknown function (DUF6011)